ncbi:MAG: hypothetical protein ABFS32_23475 [Bacteroidota bacterium]
MIFNFSGIIIALLGLVMGSIFSGNGDNLGFSLVAGFTVVIVDLIYRNKNKLPFEGTPYFHPKMGGQIMFIPIWIWGIIFICMDIFS